MRLAIIAVVAMFAPPASGLASVRQACLARTPQPRLSRACSTMLFNSDRSRRAAGAGDRKVTLKKPLGLELVNGPGNSVVIADILDGSSAQDAERRGLLKKGDIVVMCSATFGDSMWSCRGAGRDRVVKAIAVRAGDVSLVLEEPAKFAASSKAAAAADAKMRKAKEDQVKSLQEQIVAEEEGKKGGRGPFKLW